LTGGRRELPNTIPAVLGRQPLAELIRSTLSRIPSRFGQLVYLARCWSSDCGLYEHYGLELDHKAEDVHAALRRVHLAVWNHWLAALSLEEQFLELVEFLDGLNPRLVVQSWEPCGDPWDFVVPQAAPRAERDLFRANFRALLVLLKARFR
jgi:hypothetical protein